MANNLAHNLISLARFYLYLWDRASKHGHTKSWWHIDKRDNCLWVGYLLDPRTIKYLLKSMKSL